MRGHFLVSDTVSHCQSPCLISNRELAPLYLGIWNSYTPWHAWPHDLWQVTKEHMASKFRSLQATSWPEGGAHIMFLNTTQCLGWIEQSSVPYLCSAWHCCDILCGMQCTQVMRNIKLGTKPSPGRIWHPPILRWPWPIYVCWSFVIPTWNLRSDSLCYSLDYPGPPRQLTSWPISLLWLS